MLIYIIRIGDQQIERERVEAQPRMISVNISEFSVFAKRDRVVRT